MNSSVVGQTASANSGGQSPLYPAVLHSCVLLVLSWRSKKKEYDNQVMVFLRVVSLLALLLFLAPCGQTNAQLSPYTNPDANIGSWSWDKSRPKKSAENKEREPGETSWERLQAERETEESVPARKEALKSLSPLELWRLWRGKKEEKEGKEEDEE